MLSIDKACSSPVQKQIRITRANGPFQVTPWATLQNFRHRSGREISPRRITASYALLMSHEDLERSTTKTLDPGLDRNPTSGCDDSSSYSQRQWIRADDSGSTSSSSAGDDAAGLTHGQQQPGSGAWRFHVLTYNLLSDQYAMQYAQLLYKDVPERCLPWEQRCPLLLAELLHWAPDILCLQVSQDGPSHQPRGAQCWWIPLRSTH